MGELAHIDLFSGIGGFALACRWNGIKTVQFVEIDKFCQKVLNKNFPGVPIEPDIKQFDGKKYAGSFILTGGFPCQPFSCAGKRNGKEDDRFLWPEMLRVISEVRPRWIIGENVAGIINMELDNCISDLEREGYEVQTFIIPACAVNAPHRRDRVWICAHSLNSEHRTERGQIREEDGLQGINREALRSGRIERTDSHAPDTGNQRLQGGKESGNISINWSESRNELTGRCPNWQEPWLEVATRLCRVDDGLPTGLVRPKGWRVNSLKALGNAVVPQVAGQIIKAILNAEKI